MDAGQVVLLVYALVMVLGGILGYRAGSKVSLVSGAASGVLLLLALLLTFSDRPAGLWAGELISLALGAVFAVRLVKTGRFMPSGLLLLVSVAALVLLLLAAAR